MERLIDILQSNLMLTSVMDQFGLAGLIVAAIGLLWHRLNGRRAALWLRSEAGAGPRASSGRS